MRRNPRLFSDQEYVFLHHVFLKNREETNIFMRIKNKRGVDLDKVEVKHVKRRYEMWRDLQENGNQIMFVNGARPRQNF